MQQPLIDLGDICVVLPAYNEASRLDRVVQRIRNAGFEHILLVNDGSKDGTYEVAKRLNVSNANHPINRGAGAAIQTGIVIARRQKWSYIAFMDADDQHDPTDILKLKTRMEATSADVVIGNRFGGVSNEIPPSRKFFNFLANRMTNLFTHENYADSQSGMRLLNRKAIELINLEIDGFGFCSEMIVKAERKGLTIEETPISVSYTDYSMSKGQDFQVGLRTAFNFIWNVFLK